MATFLPVSSATFLVGYFETFPTDSNRYWAYIDAVQRDTPDPSAIPKYYRDIIDKFNTWFRVTRFEDAPKNILSQCTVASSGATLSQASRHSMSPYFIIDYKEE